MTVNDLQRYRGTATEQDSLKARSYEIKAKDLTTVEQGVPLRLAYGFCRVAAVQATPVYALRSEELENDQTKGKGSGAPSSYKWFGSFALAIAWGVENLAAGMTELVTIQNGDTNIWAGPPVDSTSADSHGKTTINTTIGRIDFYWGKADQDPSTRLAAITIDLGAGPVSVPVPGWHKVMWADCVDVAFGQQDVPPTLFFTFHRQVGVLDSTTSTPYQNGVVPEVIYDLLTNRRYGAGLVDVDEDSFDDCAVTTISEGLFLSPQLDAQENLAPVIADLLQAIDAVVYLDHGLLKMRLIRKASTAGLAVLDESDLLDEPLPSPQNWDQTWNNTIVTFTDSENKWEQNSVAYDDPANAAIVGQSVTKTFDMPAITTHDVAVKVATRLGVRGGLPSIMWELTLKPSLKTLLPGDRFKLTYGALGIDQRVVRVKSVTRGGPTSPEIKVTVQEEETRTTANDYLTPPENFAIPGTIDEDGTDEFPPVSVVPRVSWLPSALKSGFLDGFVMCCSRLNLYTTRGTVYIGINGVANKPVRNFTSFPAKAQVVCWHQIDSTHWLLRVRPDTDTDYDWIQSLVESSADVYAIVGRRDVRTVSFTKSEHQVLSPWLNVVNDGYFDLLSDEIIDIEVEGGAFGTDDLRLEGSGADGYFPTTHIYFGRLKDIFIYQSSSWWFEINSPNIPRADPTRIRSVAVPVATKTTEQGPADVTPANYDRDDTTMCANGTFSTEWGAAAMTSYEKVSVQVGEKILAGTAADYPDIEDLADALGEMVFGTETSDQSLLATDISLVLGGMIADGHRYYAA